MENKTIITVSRQFGSEGHEIGKEITDQLGIPFYGKELVEIAAKESSMDEELFEEDDAHTSRKFRLLGVSGYSLGGPLSAITELSLNDRLYLVQEEIIKSVACEGSCVIVRRYADYVLRDRGDALNMCIHADIEDHKEHAVHSYGVSERDIEGSTKEIDKRRANYYEYYTNRKWGRAENYDISINSSTFGTDGAVETIRVLAQKKAL